MKKTVCNISGWKCVCFFLISKQDKLESTKFTFAEDEMHLVLECHVIANVVAVTGMPILPFLCTNLCNLWRQMNLSVLHHCTTSTTPVSTSSEDHWWQCSSRGHTNCTSSSSSSSILCLIQDEEEVSYWRNEGKQALQIERCNWWSFIIGSLLLCKQLVVLQSWDNSSLLCQDCHSSGQLVQWCLDLLELLVVIGPPPPLNHPNLLLLITFLLF
jgi:hypothetical protein